jgi:3-oxoacyl-[acyl-carrier protein] reductase
MIKHGERAPRHILVSGGSRGLGQTIVEELLKAGYRVSAMSRHPSEFTRALAGEPLFHFHEGDVACSGSIVSFVTEARRRFGLPYGLVNCAGVAVDGVLATMSDAQIDRMLSINLAGALRLTRQVVRVMLLSREGGAIINVSSIMGLRGYSGLAVYAATKGGLDAFTRALARELGGRGIRVNSVAPGYLETEMTHGLDEKQRTQIVRRTPLGRLATPRDVIGAVMFLLSDASSFITGQVLVVDGGVSA